MTSSAPWGSNTPGPKTYGCDSIFRRSVTLGWVQRDAGTLKPSGRSGVETSSIRTSLPRARGVPRPVGSAVVVVDLAVVRAVALCDLGRHHDLGRSDQSIHTAQLIKQSDRSEPIDDRNLRSVDGPRRYLQRVRVGGLGLPVRQAA